jgi:hypothetical protein
MAFSVGSVSWVLKGLLIVLYSWSEWKTCYAFLRWHRFHCDDGPSAVIAKLRPNL